MASIQLKDLVPGKNYKVKVRAKHKGDDPGPWSKILNFKAPIKSQNDDDDPLNLKYGVIIGSKKDPKRGYIISSTFNGKIKLKDGLNINDDKGNDNIGTQGWAIDHKGNSIFNNIVARGQLIIDLNNNQGRMYFGENIPAFGTDKADGIKLDDYNYWFRTKSIADKRPSWRVGDANSFLSYNPDSDSANGKLIVKGQIQAGLNTGNQVLLGANVGGAGISGIKIDDSNFWYDADKVSSGAVLKVSGSDKTAITVNKDGRVVIYGNHSGGTIVGNLTVKWDEGSNTDKLIVGSNVRNNGEDGLLLNQYNYWTLSPNNRVAYFGVGDANEYVRFNSQTGKVQISGDVNIVSAKAGSGVFIDNAGRIYSGRTAYDGPTAGKGWYFENNYGEPRFFIGENANYMAWDGTNIQIRGGTIKTVDTDTRVEMNSNGIFGYVKDPVTKVINKTFWIDASDGTSSFEGNVNTKGGNVLGDITVTGGSFKIPYATNQFIFIGKNVNQTTNDGLYLNANNYWYIGNSSAGTNSGVSSFKVGTSTSNLLFSSALLTLTGADIKLTSGGDILLDGGVIRTSSSATTNGVVIDKSGLYGYSGGKTTFYINSANGNAEFAGFLKKGAKIQIPVPVPNSPPTKRSALSVRDETGGDDDTVPNSAGVQFGDNLVIATPAEQSAYMVFTRGVRDGDQDGAIFPSNSSKYTFTGTKGAGIVIGNKSGYPIMEVGYQNYNPTTAVRTDPIIKLSAASSLLPGTWVSGSNISGKLYGPEISMNGSNFGIMGGNSSYIAGMDIDNGTADKVLGRTTGGFLRWYAPSSGGGTANLQLNTNAQALLSYNSTTGTMGIDPPAANTVFAGVAAGSGSAAWRALVINDIPASFVNSVSNTSVNGISLSKTTNREISLTGTITAYTNATNSGNANKITYSGGAPGSGRTNGDIHFAL